MSSFAQEQLMKTRLNFIAITVTLALSTVACSGMSKRDQNTATGAVIGGAAGAILSGGSGAGTVGGAAVGGIIGNQVDRDKR
jgi:osmotically inducible lipoprotein OsmB